MRLMRGMKKGVFFDNVRVPAKYLVGGENNGWKGANSYLELEHGGGGSVADQPLFRRLIEHCQKADFDGESLMEDQDIRDEIADMLIDLDVQRLMGLRNFWHRYGREPHAYGGPPDLSFQRVVQLRHFEPVETNLRYDGLL